MRDRHSPHPRRLGLALAISLVAAMGAGSAQAAEYGTGPWVKGYTDIFGGILPPQPGLYVRADAYHYEGEVSATVFNGRVAFGVEEDYLNHGTYQSVSVTAWMASTPDLLLATNFKVPETTFTAFPTGEAVMPEQG